MHTRNDLPSTPLSTLTVGLGTLLGDPLKEVKPSTQQVDGNEKEANLGTGKVWGGLQSPQPPPPVQNILNTTNKNHNFLLTGPVGFQIKVAC